MASTAVQSSSELDSGLRARKQARRDSSSSSSSTFPNKEHGGNDAETETLRGESERVMGRTPDGTGEPEKKILIACVK